MFVDLLNNLAITTASLFVAGAFFRNRSFGLAATRPTRVIVGAGSGLLGILLMMSTIMVTESVILDLRNLAILIAAVFGGPLGALISGLIIGAMRIAMFGVSTASLAGGILAVFLGIFFGLVLKLKLRLTIKFVLMVGMNLVVSSIFFSVLISELKLLIHSLLYYQALNLIAAFFVYSIIQYIMNSNENHRSILYFKLMADNSTDLISTHNPDGTFKYLSPSCVKLLGYDPEELVGEDPYTYYHPEDLNKVKQSHDNVMNTSKEHRVRYRFRRKDGKYIWFETVSRKMSGGRSDSSLEIICASRDITKSKQIEEELLRANSRLQQLSLLDGLTGIPNRRALDKRLAEAWSSCAEQASPLSFILFDVDHFKAFNDTYGHQVGDECLKQISHAVQANLDEQSEFIARYGGEEFAVVLVGMGETEAARTAEKLRSAVQSLEIPHAGSSVAPYVTISCGAAALIPSEDGKMEDLVLAADTSLYHAKEHGRNRVEVFQ